MARDRSDTRWSQAREPWQRLAWARSTHGNYPTPTSFARAAKLEPHTYAAYERDPDNASKATKLDFDHAAEWAPMLDVSFDWLFQAKGLPWREEAQVISTAGLSVDQIALINAMAEQMRRVG